MNIYSINSVYFSRGLINVPKYSIVRDGVETLEPLFDMNTVAEDPRYKVAMAISIELMRFGKILSPAAFYGISQLRGFEQQALAEHIKEYLGKVYCDGTYLTLFGDFPNTVLGMSEGEMLVHQIVHYWGAALGIEYWPNMTEGFDAESKKASVQEMLFACCKDKYDVFEAASGDDLADSIKVLVSSQQSLTSRDKEMVRIFYSNLDSFHMSPLKKLEMKTIEIPFKETLCIIADACPDAQVCKDINDVLRVAMHMSGADISLAPIPTVKDYGWRKVAMTKADKKPWNFKNFTNPQTRQLLSSIDRIVEAKKDDAFADMKKYASRWIRLGEKLHPASAKNMKKYPNAAVAFQVIRNAADEIKTFGSAAEAAKKDMDLDKILKVYSKRPGEFVRQLDWILRTFIDNKSKASKKTSSNTLIGDALKNLGVFNEYSSEISEENMKKIYKYLNDSLKKVSTKVLYELLDHFHERREEMHIRQVVIKGARKPVDLPLLDPIKKDTADFVEGLVLTELISRMSKKENLVNNTVFIDKELQNLNLPKNMRSTGEAVFQVSRGSKMPLPEISKLLRFFLFWKDEHGNEDLDLTVQFYGKDFDNKGAISWNTRYKLTNQFGEQYAQFSGDVRHKRGNCAEYVDVDINAALRGGIKYLVATAHDFNAHSFSTGYGGVMARTAWGTQGETTWAPATVENGFKINSTTQNVVLCIIDLESRQLIVVDEDLTGIPMNHTLDARRFDRLYSVLDRYVNSKRFFNGLSLIATYYRACGADVHVVSAEEIEKIKNVRQEMTLVHDGQKTIADDSLAILETKYETICETYNLTIDQYVKYVTFDDIAKDYSKLLGYMF